MNRDLYKFEILYNQCKREGLTDRETAFVISSGSVIVPFPEDIKAFRDFQSKGIRPNFETYGFETLKRGQAQIESIGDLCSNYVRKTAYFNGNINYAWEGTEYWKQYPKWYTKILLYWHPKFKNE